MEEERQNQQSNETVSVALSHSDCSQEEEVPLVLVEHDSLCNCWSAFCLLLVLPRSCSCQIFYNGVSPSWLTPSNTSFIKIQICYEAAKLSRPYVACCLFPLQAALPGSATSDFSRYWLLPVVPASCPLSFFAPPHLFLSLFSFLLSIQHMKMWTPVWSSYTCI